MTPLTENLKKMTPESLKYLFNNASESKAIGVLRALQKSAEDDESVTYTGTANLIFSCSDNQEEAIALALKVHSIVNHPLGLLLMMKISGIKVTLNPDNSVGFIKDEEIDNVIDSLDFLNGMSGGLFTFIEKYVNSENPSIEGLCVLLMQLLDNGGEDDD